MRLEALLLLAACSTKPSYKYYCEVRGSGDNAVRICIPQPCAKDQQCVGQSEATCATNPLDSQTYCFATASDCAEMERLGGLKGCHLVR